MLAPTSNADLVLPSETASLAIPDWGSRFNRDLYWLVSRDGRLFNLSWQTGKWGGLWSPLSIQMESGAWKIVRVSSFEDWLRLATAGGNALTPVVEFRLDPAEAKTIHLHGTEKKEVSP